MTSIAIVNDNSKRLSGWKKAMEPADSVCFSHPNYLIFKLKDDCSSFSNIDLYLLDRFYYGSDLLKEDFLKEIKRLVPRKDALFIMTSSYHDIGDKIDGFDLVLSGKPMSLDEIRDNFSGQEK